MTDKRITLREALDTDIFAAVKKLQEEVSKKVDAIVIPEYIPINILT